MGKNKQNESAATPTEVRKIIKEELKSIQVFGTLNSGTDQYKSLLNVSGCLKKELINDEIRASIKEETRTNLYWMLTYVFNKGGNPLKPKSHFLFGLDRDGVLLFLVSVALILQALNLIRFF